MNPYFRPIPPAIGGQYPLPDYIPNHPNRDHHTATIQYNLERQAPTPQFNPRVPAVPIDEYGQIDGEVQDRQYTAEPIYRSAMIVANNRFSPSAFSSTSNMQIAIGNDRIDAKNPSILVNEISLQDVVGVRLDPFYVPASMISAIDLAFDDVLVRFPMFSGIALGNYDYLGSFDSVRAQQFHFQCTATLSSKRYLLTPRNPYLNFGFPVRIANNQWQMEIVSPIRGALTMPAPLQTGAVFPSNPLTIIGDHGLITGDQITIDTTGLNMSYTPNTVAYTVTFVDGNTFTIPVDGTTLSGDEKITYTIIHRVIRVSMRLDSMDRRSDIMMSTRSVLTLGH